MKTWKDEGEPPASGSENCPMCGQKWHRTKAETLRCSQTRRKTFAELDALVAEFSTKKPPA